MGKSLGVFSSFNRDILIYLGDNKNLMGDTSDKKLSFYKVFFGIVGLLEREVRDFSELLANGNIRLRGDEVKSIENLIKEGRDYLDRIEEVNKEFCKLVKVEKNWCKFGEAEVLLYSNSLPNQEFIKDRNL
ncbi:MAG: hypothetical protein QMD65_01920 [Patescibacteria group bacterium]|nr:hypothetical protein [Patescibacteria group bacterium]